MRVVLSCGARKGPAAAPAIELYTGNYFRALARFARRFDSPIFILSAKYGLVRSSTILEPYDMRLGDPLAVTPSAVALQAARLGIAGRGCLVLGGSEYVELLRRARVRVVSLTDIVGRPLMMMQQAAYLRDNAREAEIKARELVEARERAEPCTTN
jgi:hypothetical protein